MKLVSIFRIYECNLVFLIYCIFRKDIHYTAIVGGTNAFSFAEYIRKHCEYLLLLFSQFEKIDQIGGPTKVEYPGIGMFSEATLRYIYIADRLSKIFDLPKASSIVEIGGGFGDQCYLLSKILPGSQYLVYDLPEVNGLINKVFDQLGVANASSEDIKDCLPKKPIDLLISNYAFSECAYDTQMRYFEEVILHVDRGYMLTSIMRVSISMWMQ